MGILKLIGYIAISVVALYVAGWALVAIVTASAVFFGILLVGGLLVIVANVISRYLSGRKVASRNWGECDEAEDKARRERMFRRFTPEIEAKKALDEASVQGQLNLKTQQKEEYAGLIDPTVPSKGNTTE